jgi:hypothetical protein
MTKKEDYQQMGQAIQNTAQVMPSVLESLARGGIAQVPGTVGDISQTAREFFPQTMQSTFGNRQAPTTEEILQAIPRINPDYQGSQSHETVGGLIGPALGKMLKMGAEATKGMKGGLSIENIDRMKVAQYNASLPIKEGGLGLPTNNTSMDRAKAMGFDTPVYHGTKETNIESFDPSLGVGVTGRYKGANEVKSHLPYTWGSVEPSVASAYSLKSSPRGKSLDEFMQSINFDQVMASGTNKEKKEVEKLFKEWKKENPDYNKVIDASTVYPLLVKAENPKVIDAKFETYSSNAKTKPNVLAEKSFSGRKKTGNYDLLMIENFNDPPVRGWGGGTGTHVAIKDPSQIRSRFAAFDPKRIKETDILAGGLALPASELTRRELIEKQFK